ncbi:MAG: hypothetical protein ABMB14_27255 [Myxococcota bacterium]
MTIPMTARAGRAVVWLGFAILAACPAEPGPTDTDADTADTDTDTDADTDTDTDELAIVGTYLDVYDTEHVVTDATWTQTYLGYDPLVFEIAGWDNDAGWVSAHNGADNAYDPGAWSRFDWQTGDDGHLYYCQVAFAAPTRDDAEAAAAEPDLATGCGGFPWTDLTP